jgi:hypothetical protein
MSYNNRGDGTGVERLLQAYVDAFLNPDPQLRELAEVARSSA